MLCQHIPLSLTPTDGWHTRKVWDVNAPQQDV